MKAKTEAEKQENIRRAREHWQSKKAAKQERVYEQVCRRAKNAEDKVNRKGKTILAAKRQEQAERELSILQERNE